MVVAPFIQGESRFTVSGQALFPTPCHATASQREPKKRSAQLTPMCCKYTQQQQNRPPTKTLRSRHRHCRHRLVPVLAAIHSSNFFSDVAVSNHLRVHSEGKAGTVVNIGDARLKIRQCAVVVEPGVASLKALPLVCIVVYQFVSPALFSLARQASATKRVYLSRASKHSSAISSRLTCARKR